MVTMSEVRTIGLDLAKNRFQVHGADASGAVATWTGFEILWGAAALSGRNGSLRKFSFLGSRDRPLGARGPDDPAGLRKTVCKVMLTSP
jgi:hypothetical protein